MDAKIQARNKRKQELLRELAELNIQEQVEEGVFLETPHYSVIELAAMNLGRELSREAQQRGAREIAAQCDTQVACPDCNAVCKVRLEQRTVTGLSGPVELTETVANCPKCRRAFFPSTRSDGVR